MQAEDTVQQSFSQLHSTKESLLKKKKKKKKKGGKCNQRT
jgi:hypothetical protein